MRRGKSGSFLRLAGILCSGATLLAAAPSAIHLTDAIKAGDRATAAALLRQRVDVNVAEPDGTTALHWAVHQDDLALTEQLLHLGARVAVANRYGVTPLYLACVNGNATIIDRLLAAGADPNAVSSEGETALMTAARSGRVEAAIVLLKHGAEIDARESWRGQTALMWAAAQDHPAMVHALIAHGADVNARSKVQEWERQTTAEPREKWLSPGGMTPLFLAARQGALASVKALVEEGARLDARTPEVRPNQGGLSPLVVSIINGHYDVAAFLVEHGADPNLADAAGRTPLYATVDMNTMPASNRPAPKVLENRVTALDLAKMLLERGGHVNAQLKTQQPYRTKLDRGDDTMLTTGTSPLLRAAKAGDVPMMHLLLAHGADPTLATRGGVNPLMAAAGLGTKEEDTTGRSKTQKDAIDAINLMLEAGLDVNAVDSRGQTALHGAALQGFDDVVRFLAARGARLDVKDRRGFTPLDAALGNAGGVGFDGQASLPHPTTAALLRELLANPVTVRGAPPF